MAEMLSVVEALEPRQLLAWGDYPQLIGQDRAVERFPRIDGRGTAIALIDTGVDFNHPALAGKVSGGYDFYRNDGHAEDENGHGTAMAGIMAGRRFTFGGAEYQGVAPGAKVIPLKAADPTGRVSDITFAQKIEKALQWVLANRRRHNIVAVNMSLRVRSTADYDATFRDEIRKLAKADVFMVATSRNPPNDPNTHRFPAADRNVFTAGIVNADGGVSTYRRWHARDDLLAPGNAVPVALLGRGTFGPSGEATSYAAPFITATAALIRQIDRRFTNAQTAYILHDSAARVKDPETGRVYKRLAVDRAVALARKRSKAMDRAARAAEVAVAASVPSLFSSRRVSEE